MLNKVHLIGHLGHSPEIRQTKEGKDMAILSLATHSSWKHSKSEPLSKDPSERAPVLSDKLERESNLYSWERKTEWHRVIVLRETLVTWIKEYLRKGDLVFVEGKLVYTERQTHSIPNQRVANIVISGWDGTLKLIPSQKQPSLKQFPLKDTLGKAEEEEEDNNSLFQKNSLGDPANEK